MQSDPHQRIKAILSSGDFRQFIGLKEDDLFEAKGRAPYDLNAAQGRYELAKDVSAFANSGGGHIIVGLTHQKLETENTDEIVGLELVQQADFSVTQYVGVIKQHVYPPIVGLEVTWIEAAETSALGVACVYVPAQDPNRKFYLITKIVEDGEPQREIIVGIARRLGADNTPFTAKDVYRFLQQGVSPQTQRLTRIEEKLDSILGRRLEGPAAMGSLDLLPSRIERILER